MRRKTLAHCNGRSLKNWRRKSQAEMRARDDSRTLFVVGDKKQSIYSFQGADAAEFDRMKLKFNDQLALTPTPLNDRSLAYSFRSSSAILETVDAVFKDKAPSGFTPEEDHKAFKDRMPGAWIYGRMCQRSKRPRMRLGIDPLISPLSIITIPSLPVISPLKSKR